MASYRSVSSVSPIIPILEDFEYMASLREQVNAIKQLCKINTIREAIAV